MLTPRAHPLFKTSPNNHRALKGAGFLLLGAFMIQWAAAVVHPAFVKLGPSGAAGWRLIIGGIILLAIARPKLGEWKKIQWLAALAFGTSTALMSFFFYSAISRMPMGGSVAIEYLGPFLVAALGKRSVRHYAFVVLAGVGVVALTRPGSGLNLAGIIFACLAALSWALYVFTNHRVGNQSPGLGGFAVSMMMGGIIMAPFSLSHLSIMVHQPGVAVRMVIVSVMAVVLGFGFEMQSLRRLRPSTVGVLMAFDPALAFLMGALVLGQTMHPLDAVGLLCVVAAGVGVTYESAGDSVGLAQ
jgi:inner membrane transporter RhtA